MKPKKCTTNALKKKINVAYEKETRIIDPGFFYRSGIGFVVVSEPLALQPEPKLI
jgi:hypothetical protein